jgi:hypothetical protein
LIYVYSMEIINYYLLYILSCMSFNFVFNKTDYVFVGFFLTFSDISLYFKQYYLAFLYINVNFSDFQVLITENNRLMAKFYI